MSLDITLYVNYCPHCGRGKEEVWHNNITHNLTDLARHVGIYEYVWRPEETIDVRRANDLIGPLMRAIAMLQKNPNFYKTFDSPNGWGTFEQFCEFLNDYLNACKKYPNAVIETDR